MDNYQGYSILILDKDYSKAQMILEKSYQDGDIDNMHYTRRFYTIDGKKLLVVHYRIYPYIHEDYEFILNEFEQEGIRIL